MITDDPYMSVSSKIAFQKRGTRLGCKSILSCKHQTDVISVALAYTHEKKTNLVGITTNARHPADTEIERGQFVTAVFTIRKTSLFEERDDEGTETTVDVETNVVFRGECTERNDIILIAIREVDRGAYELRDVM